MSKRLSTKTITRRVSIFSLNLLLYLSIVLLVSDIQRTRTHWEDATLLTPGTDIQQLIAEHAANEDTHPIFVLEQALSPSDSNHPDTTPDHWQIIHQPEHLITVSDSLQKLIIKGDGLSARQLRDLQALATSKFQQPLLIEFMPSAAYSGFINMQWHKQLVVGQQQQISGALQFPEDTQRAMEVSLIDPAGDVLAVQRVKADEVFSFNVVAKKTGQWLYSLALFDPSTNQTLLTEPIAFDVAQYDPPMLTIYQSAPSFEIRHLTNWAAQFGTNITVITKISQANTIIQHINKSPVPDSSNQQQVSLDDIDINRWQQDAIIMDGRTWLNLTDIQHQALQHVVEQGTGLLLVADRDWLSAQNRAGDADKPLPSQIASPWFHIGLRAIDNASSQQTSIMTWQGTQSKHPIPYLAAQLVTTPVDVDSEILVRTVQGVPIVASQQVGKGRVAVSLISNSYQWQLSGEKSDFSQFWQALLARISKPAQPPYWIPQDDKVSRTHQAERLCAISAQDQLKNARLQSYYVNPAQQIIPLLLSADVLDHGKLCGLFWPLENAWYDVVISDGERTDTMRLYSYGDQDWRAWQQYGNHLATEKASRKTTVLRPKAQSTPESKLPIWILFLIVAGMLWIERKFFS